MIGLESCYGAVNTILHHQNKMDQLSVIKLLTVNPRKIIGFNEDLFKVGTPAELVIMDPNQEWEFSKGNIFSKSKNSPFVGKKFKGKVHSTIVKNHMSFHK